jgi:transposase
VANDYGMDPRDQPNLEAEMARLRAANSELEQRLSQAHKHIEQLKATIEKLKAALEEAQRSRKRQAAPFRNPDGPKAKPKKPGRKSGKRHGRHGHGKIPSTIDEHYDVPFPDKCPNCCGDNIAEKEVVTQYQTEIPQRPIHRQFDVHIGECQNCGCRVHGRHELQTSDAIGAAASQLGPGAHAAFVILNKELGLSHGKCARVFKTLFGIPVARATSARSILRTAQLAEPAYEQLRLDIRDSSVVVPDETGWRVGGMSAWLHAFATESATCYDIGDRSGAIAEDLLGLAWSGTMIHDGWSVYDRFQAASHQQCLGHLQRRCQRILETAVGAAARLPRTVLEIIDQAFAFRRAWRGHRLDCDELAIEGLLLSADLEEVVSGTFTYEPNRLLAAHILNHAMQWFWFLIDPTIDATNYRGEQALRPGVVNRKVWGGNRTWVGAVAQKVLMSLGRTLFQRGQDVLNWFSQLRRSPTQLILPAAARPPTKLILPAGAR